MAKVKIISNPYKKEIRYQRWDSEAKEWCNIDYDNNKNSQLLNRELVEGFFPFKAYKIVSAIIDEYGIADNLVDIYFEGSDDEFQELEAVCAIDAFKEKVIPIKADVYLANARDILPAVRKLFQDMSPLILQSVNMDKIQRDLNRFTDASSDVVPICIFGNYSAGKSTFINALIGNEILPSGTEPITAKVYKISRSKFVDRAYVKFKFIGYDVHIQFTEKETIFDNEILKSDIKTKIQEALSANEIGTISSRVNTVLSVINDYERDSETPDISDLIEVDLPFVKGVLSETQHPVVLFDTPGSNSASNERHLEVLKQAMANMTNGLPVFLCTPDSLDSKDNENLYHIIRDLDELDSRFTMIVVNKADSAVIQRRVTTPAEQNRILRQAVPKNLYSGGLFYVSSIIGLGAKTDGVFRDIIYEDVYDAQEKRYNDPENKHYRTLYKLNILPAQLKIRTDQMAASSNDLIYANSGMFTIESEMEAFAAKYSAYNKCFQSQMFLMRVIEITEQEIEDKKVECEGIRQSINDKLEADKKVLTDKLNDTSVEQRDIYVNGYEDFMREYLEGAEETFSANDLREQEAIFTKMHEESNDYDAKSEDAQRARAALADNLKNNVINAFKEKNPSAVKTIVEKLQSDFENSKDSFLAQRETRHQVDKQAADSLLKYVSEKYDQRLNEIYTTLDAKSREYWTNNTEALREILAKIVAGSEVLTDDRRKELERIIITYRQISFSEDSAERIFDKINFERRIKIGQVVLWESDHLDIDKLVFTYNINIERGANARYKSIEESHRDSAFSWIQSLLDEIYENIVEYSPELSKQAKRIRIMTENIVDLVKRKVRLNQYTDELKQMMDWQVVQS